MLALGLTTLACAPLTIPEERALGEQANAEIRQEVRLVRDEVVAGYVREMGERIAAAAGPQPYQFRFYVIEADEINAFALPAGYIYMHTQSLLKARNASEVAGVLAHEIGHVVERHVAENYNRQRGVGIAHQVGVLTAGILGGGAAAAAADVGGGFAGMAYLNKFGREAEREADAFAVKVLPRAGWDPHGLTTFFETLLEESHGEPPAFLSSHPATRERIDNTRQMIAAEKLPGNLRVQDNGRLQIVQRRISLLK
jgi:predicted Zn-dependent protease